jgi:hypothetical protein
MPPNRRRTSQLPPASSERGFSPVRLRDAPLCLSGYNRAQSLPDFPLHPETTCLNLRLGPSQQRDSSAPSAAPSDLQLETKSEYIICNIARGDSQLSLPSMKLYTGCKPNKVRKYQDRLETHRTSRSRVPTPDCSIALNCGVRGKGSFTIARIST